MRILIVEDVDQKFDEVRLAVESSISAAEIERAQTVVDGQDAISGRDWDLVIIDISMDIASQTGARMREGHANLGGMDIIEQMYLLGKDTPTIIVTGFDYFVPSDREEIQVTQSFADLGTKASKWLKDKFLGSIRYGKPGWEDSLKEAIGRRPL